MTKEHKIRIILHGLVGLEREAEKLRLLTDPSKIETELKRKWSIAFAKRHKSKQRSKNNITWKRKRYVRFHINFTPAECLFVTRNAEKRGFKSVAAYIRSRLVAVKQ